MQLKNLEITGRYVLYFYVIIIGFRLFLLDANDETTSINILYNNNLMYKFKQIILDPDY